MNKFDELDISSLDLDFLEEFQDGNDDGDEDTLLAQSTKDRREHLRKIWYRFWTVAKQDPEEIWIGLCQPKKAVRAAKLCEAFLHTYATRTRKRRICLGPEEYEVRRSVTSATTLLLCWRSLVSEFDQTLLARKRREDPDNMGKWSLKFKDGFLTGKGQGPVADVARWIAAHADDMGLTREQTFVKKEATAEDVALVLRTLWTRAEDIPCDPVTRVSFHNTLLLGAICGFRPGVLENMKYRQVTLEILRDPKTQQKRIVATFTVRQNKQHAGAIRHDQSHVLNFSVALVPQKIFCPVSLVIARALSDDAFDPSFDSVHSLLSRPNLEHTQCIPLQWKDDAIDREIFPLTYNRFGELWRRTVLVAGYPERIRPYAIRVGAGSRLDGVFTHALRNYLLSHTSGVFGRSYQTRHIRENLMPALTPETDRDEELFQLLRQACLRCDDAAPIYPTRDDIHRWEQTRKDLRNLRESSDRAKSSKRQQIINRLSQLQVDEMRATYFKEAERRRALGLSTADLAQGRAPNPRSCFQKNAAAAEVIGDFLGRKQDASCGDDASIEYMDKLVAYLENRPIELETSLKSLPVCFLCPGASLGTWKDVWQHTRRKHSASYPSPCPECMRLGLDRCIIKNLSDWSGHVHELHAEGNDEPPRCLLGCGTYVTRSALNMHYHSYHTPDLTFAVPFPCPECRRLGRGDCLISNSAGWIDHVERCHDPKHAPYSRDGTAMHRCLLCDSDRGYATLSALSRHTTVCHIAESPIFASTFPCPECRRLGWADCFIHSPSEWSSHVASCHGREHAPSLPSSSIRCLLCDKSVRNVKYHVLRHFDAGLFSEPFACPECVRLGQEAKNDGAVGVPRIHGYDAWRNHSAAVHSEAAPAMGPKERTRCLVCDQAFNDMPGHFGRKHVRGGLFSQPFRCPECARKGMAEGDGGPLISTREEWHIHCEAIHNDTSPSTAGGSLELTRKRQRSTDDASANEDGSRKRSILSPGSSAPPIDPALFKF